MDVVQLSKIADSLAFALTQVALILAIIAINKVSRRMPVRGGALVIVGATLLLLTGLGPLLVTFGLTLMSIEWTTGLSDAEPWLRFVEAAGIGLVAAGLWLLVLREPNVGQAGNGLR